MHTYAAVVVCPLSNTVNNYLKLLLQYIKVNDFLAALVIKITVIVITYESSLLTTWLLVPWVPLASLGPFHVSVVLRGP